MADSLGYVDTLRILVDKGADVNAKDSKRVSDPISVLLFWVGV